MATKKTTAAAKKPAAKKPATKKAPAKKAPAKKAVVKKAPAKKVAKRTKKQAPVLISVKDVKKNYGKVKVLKGVSFDVKEGERVAILGANGAGKSTLTEIISYIKEPSKGKVEYSFGKTKKDISSQIGIQFQRSSYPMFYRVKDIVNFFLDITGIKLDKDELKALYDKFGL
jgi:ABC-type multidrug transport system ATPase subunit